MQERPITGLTSEQLARLWDLGADVADAADVDADQSRREALLDRLAGNLPPDEALMELLPRSLSHVCRQVKPFSGESLRVLLANPAVDLQVIERIKGYAKDLGTRAGSEAQREACLALYFAAIAAGLLHHEAKISQQSWKHLEDAFRRFSGQAWVPADLVELFTKAAERCQGRP